MKWTAIKRVINSSSHRIFRVSVPWDDFIFCYPVALSEFGVRIRQYTPFGRNGGAFLLKVFWYMSLSKRCSWRSQSCEVWCHVERYIGNGPFLMNLLSPFLWWSKIFTRCHIAEDWNFNPYRWLGASVRSFQSRTGFDLQQGVKGKSLEWRGLKWNVTTSCSEPSPHMSPSRWNIPCAEQFFHKRRLAFWEQSSMRKNEVPWFSILRLNMQ
jgi:hypothetical protein